LEEVEEEVDLLLVMENLKIRFALTSSKVTARKAINVISSILKTTQETLAKEDLCLKEEWEEAKEDMILRTIKGINQVMVEEVVGIQLMDK